MGRNKKYQQSEVIKKMIDLFIKKGYNSSSLDDLVEVTGILRGSLYSAFGSKQKMFILALLNSLKNNQLSNESIGMVVVAMMELSRKNDEVKNIVNDWYEKNDNQIIMRLIGEYIIKKSGINGDKNYDK